VQGVNANYPPDVSLRITVRTNGNLPPVLFALRNERGQGMNWAGCGIDDNSPAVIAEMFAQYREMRSRPPGPEPYIDIPAGWAPIEHRRSKRAKGTKEPAAPLFAAAVEANP
jgi:hypothetical protein